VNLWEGCELSRLGEEEKSGLVPSIESQVRILIVRKDVEMVELLGLAWKPRK
jgi:hypothetical protein